jgi:cyclopropane fatty-acyl-phospholipid synthase-like methyltransferase
MNNEILNFWEEAHQNNQSLWLTGSNLYEVTKPMDIYDKLVPGIKVLYIGVGLGYDTDELSKKGIIVDALDISKIALNRVKHITRNQFLSSDIKSLPINEYDFAISHLVAQHMNDENLEEQMRYVIRSLNTNGVFGIQFSFVDDNQESLNELNRVYGNVLSFDPQKKGHMFRSVSRMKDMVEHNGGKVTWISPVRTYPHTPIKWYYLHITK